MYFSNIFKIIINLIYYINENMHYAILHFYYLEKHSI